MENKSNSSPLMFIQTITNNISNDSNQHYFDSRYRIKKDTLEEVVEEKEDNIVEDNVDYSALINKVKMIEAATKSGMKITCEVCLKNSDILYGDVVYSNDRSFYVDELLVNFLEVTEINIQTIKNT